MMHFGYVSQPRALLLLVSHSAACNEIYLLAHHHDHIATGASLTTGFTFSTACQQRTRYGHAAVSAPVASSDIALSTVVCSYLNAGTQAAMCGTGESVDVGKRLIGGLVVTSLDWGRECQIYHWTLTLRNFLN